MTLYRRFMGRRSKMQSYIDRNDAEKKKAFLSEQAYNSSARCSDGFLNRFANIVKQYPNRTSIEQINSPHGKISELPSIIKGAWTLFADGCIIMVIQKILWHFHCWNPRLTLLSQISSAVYFPAGGSSAPAAILWAIIKLRYLHFWKAALPI